MKSNCRRHRLFRFCWYASKLHDDDEGAHCNRGMKAILQYLQHIYACYPTRLTGPP